MLQKGKTSGTVIKHFKSIFSRHGIPEIVIADNMPFNSFKTNSFAGEFGFQMKTSSPEYPQSNGQSERAIGTVKQLKRKALEENNDVHLASLHYRNTPVSGMAYSPAQLLMSRNLRDGLPVAEEVLRPKVAERAHQGLLKRQQKYEEYSDKGTRELPKLQSGDPVHVILWKHGLQV